MPALGAGRQRALKRPWGALLVQPEGFGLGHCCQSNNTRQGDYPSSVGRNIKAHAQWHAILGVLCIILENAGMSKRCLMGIIKNALHALL